MLEGVIVVGILGIVLVLFISLVRGRRRKSAVVNVQQEEPIPMQNNQPRIGSSENFSVRSLSELRSGQDRRGNDDRREIVRFSEDGRTNAGRRKEDRLWASNRFSDKK